MSTPQGVARYAQTFDSPGLTRAQLRLSPTLEEVVRLVEERQGNCIPIFATLPGDVLTPVLAYLRLSHGAALDAPPSFLLESVLEGSYQARYSFVGSGALRCFVALRRARRACRYLLVD